MLSREHLGADLVAGITVACIAVPLSLAIALASGVAPVIGLVTAIVASVVGALFGGTRLAVSGPAAAMAVLVASLVQAHGLAALLVIGIGCGVLQLLTGVFGLGRFIRLVPLPVIEGFTAGIGAIILIGQLPRALGLPATDASHVVDVVTHIADLLHQTRGAAVAITVGALLVIYLLPRLTARVPPHLAAVVIATLAVVAGLDAATLGDIPRSFPAPSLPAFPPAGSIATLLGATFMVYALASLETLLSSAAVDKLASGPRSDPDQDLVGQGLANITTALFGGIPVTGVIARSAANVQAGAKTRRAAIVHAVVLVLVVLVAAPLIGRIPIAALAAVLFSVALRMLDPRAFLRLWRHSRADGAVFAVTFFVIVFAGLLEGVQWGIAAALAIAAIQLGRTRMLVRGARAGEHYLFELERPLTFMSSFDVDNLRRELDLLEPDRGALVDVRAVSMMDASGAEMLAGILEHARDRRLRPVLLGLNEDQRAMLLSAAGDHDLRGVLAGSQSEAMALLGESTSADHQLNAGVERYRRSTRPSYTQLFEQLAEGQAPHTLFITCSDSRVVPNLITGTDPGDLFIVRNIGNLIPPERTANASSVAAAVDYAVGVLGVRKIVVCGHSGCGAIKQLLATAAQRQPYPNLEAWLDVTEIRGFLQTLPRSLSADDVARLVVRAQVHRLRSYRIVADALAHGGISLSPWFFDVAAGEIEEWSITEQDFVAVGATADDQPPVEETGIRRLADRPTPRTQGSQ